MIFLTPLGLLGLFSLPVIIALHMLRERQRRKVVSSLKLWAFLEPQVHGSSPMRIPFSWLLLIDLLIAALLSLALSQPKLSIAVPLHGAKQYLILLDTSSSMLARDEIPSRIEKAQAEIAAMISGLGERDSAVLIAFGEKPHWIGDTNSDSQQELLVKLYQVKAGESGSAVNDALAVGFAQLKKNFPTEIHLFTDAAYEDPQISDLDTPITWHLLGNTTSNQAVISISTIDTMDGYQVFAQLANYSAEEISRNVTLLVDGAAVDSYAYRMPANTITPQVWRRTGSAESVSVLLAGGDQLKEDDRASAGVHFTQKPKVVVVSDEPTLFQRILSGLPEANTQVLLPSEYYEQPSVDITIFDGWLPSQFPQGTVLIVQPPLSSDQTENTPPELSAVSARTAVPSDGVLNSLMSDPMIDQLDFSGVRWGKAWTTQQPLAGFTALLSIQNSSETIPLLLRKTSAASRVYLLTADLTSGNLTRHPAFPIMIVQLIQSTQASSLPTCIQVGESILLPEPGTHQTVSVIPPQADPSEFQGAWPAVWDDTFLPGEYRIILQDSNGLSSQYTVGANAGSLLESNLAPRAWADNPQIQPLQDSPAQTTNANLDLTPWLIAAALLFLLVEAILAWR